MRKFFLIVGFLCIAVLSFSAKVASIDIPETMSKGDVELNLNGAGIRTKLFKLYVGSLYLKDQNNDGDQVINANEAMAMRLDILSGLITAEKMEDATRDGFEKSTKGNTAVLKSEIEAFLSVFREEIFVGDVFEFFYHPDRGVVIFKNGIEKNLIEGIAFKKALFGIWLCDEPAQEKLKSAMLGK